jgi:hypothetical protein
VDVFKGTVMDITCTKQLSVGNRIIDSAHKEIFDVIDRITHSIAVRNIPALTEAFDLLENCLDAYFDFTEHSVTHQDLLNEFQRINNWLMGKNGMWSKFEEKGCIDSLKNCMVRHIKEEGKPLKIVLETHFYDFKP